MALLWHDLYISILHDMDFELNQYDKCATNAIIDRKQCTICWYLEDNKIIYKDQREVNKNIKCIDTKFWKKNKHKEK